MSAHGEGFEIYLFEKIRMFVTASRRLLKVSHG